MRKQYHFRNSEQGLLVWDINRLFKLFLLIWVSTFIRPHQRHENSVKRTTVNERH
jgi:hypothetical protein